MKVLALLFFLLFFAQLGKGTEYLLQFTPTPAIAGWWWRDIA